MALVLLVAGLPAAGEGGRLTVELLGGTDYAVRTRVTVRQEGEETLHHDARWETRPFRDSPYYAVRLGLWKNGRAWELQLLHNKVYLVNPTPEIEKLEVTHGFNQLTLGRAWKVRGLVLRAGAGIVIAHAESIVRGRPFGGTGGVWEGYEIAGPVVDLGAAYSPSLSSVLFATVEAKVTGAWTEVDVAGGSATVPNLSLHALAGLGARF